MHGDQNQVYITNPNAFRPANNEVRTHACMCGWIKTQIA